MKSFSYNHSSKKLWRVLAKVRTYPKGVKPVPEQIQGTSFFPGGIGLWRESLTEVPQFPVGGVMVLGQDFDSVAGYEKSRRRGAESPNYPTWRNLLLLLDKAQIAQERCFFTNIYMGLREGTINTGPFPGSKDPEFRERCRDFFIRQLEAQRPCLILALGAYVPPFLATLSDELSGWTKWPGFRKLDEKDCAIIPAALFPKAKHKCALVALTHPSFSLNARHRRWQSFQGYWAEVQMVKHAYETSCR